MAFGHSPAEQELTARSMSRLKAAHKDVRYDWPQLVLDESLPLELAFQFLDDTLVGLAHRKAEFDLLCGAVGDALRAAVVENHEVFSNSVGLYHQLLLMVEELRRGAQEMQQLLEVSTRDVGERSGVLRELGAQLQRYEEMLEVLDAMAALRDLPGRIDLLVGERRLGEVYDAIAAGHKLAGRHNLFQLLAMGATQQYLEAQSNSLYDTVVDELKNEVFLKGVSLENWRGLVGQSGAQRGLHTLLHAATLEQHVYAAANVDCDEAAALFARELAAFLERLPAVADQNAHTYTHQLMATAAKLGRLPQALEALAALVPVEMAHFVSRTTEECKAKSQLLLRIARLADHGLSDAAVPVLQDVFGCVFLKLLAIVHRHKVACEVARLLAPELPYTFEHVWAAVRKELELLVTQYIDEEPVAVPKPRLRLFSFAAVGEASRTAEDMKLILNEMFPGFLVEKPGAEQLPYILAERLVTVDVLVPRSVYNMRVILDYFLVFAAGADAYAPALNQFADYMRLTFCAKLALELRAALERGLGFDSVVEDGGRTLHANALEFRRLFCSVCHTMNTSFAYRPELTGVVLGLLDAFLAAYHAYYKRLLSGELEFNRWMKLPQLLETLRQLLKETDPEKRRGLLRAELFAMASDPLQFDVPKEHLMDGTWFALVCHLHTSAAYVLSWLPQMRKESNYTHDTRLRTERLRHEWLFFENGRQTSDKTRLHVTLTLARVAEFDRAVALFAQIADNCLAALRFDVRLKGLYYIGKSYAEPFVLATEPADSDQQIGQYNRELFSCGTHMATLLGRRVSDAVLFGLSEFLNRALIQGSELVQVANEHGVKKALLNIFTMQQILRSLVSDPDSVHFAPALGYFGLFTTSEHAMLQRIAKASKTYTRAEALNMLRLVYSEKLHSAAALNFNRAKYSELSKKIADIYA